MKLLLITLLSLSATVGRAADHGARSPSPTKTGTAFEIVVPGAAYTPPISTR